MSYPILDTIGNTPLIEIKKLNPNPRVRLLAKLVKKGFAYEKLRSLYFDISTQ